MALGGARPNPGPKKGAVYRKKISATLEEMRQLEAQTRAPAAAKLCKDILAESANFCAGMAAYYQPKRDQKGNVIWAEGQEEKFLRYMDRANMFAARGAPYQSGTFKAIAIMDVGQGQPPINATAENVEMLDDDNGAMRVYRRLVAGPNAA